MPEVLAQRQSSYAFESVVDQGVRDRVAEVIGDKDLSREVLARVKERYLKVLDRRSLPPEPEILATLNGGLMTYIDFIASRKLLLAKSRAEYIEAGFELYVNTLGVYV